MNISSKKGGARGVARTRAERLVGVGLHVWGGAGGRGLHERRGWWSPNLGWIHKIYTPNEYQVATSSRLT